MNHHPITHTFACQYASASQKIGDYLTKHAQFALKMSNDTVFWQDEYLQLICRQYAKDKPGLSNLSPIEKTIMHCVYTRHHNGFIRQAHLQALLDSDYPIIAVPFAFQLLGEYVLAIYADVFVFIKKYPDLSLAFIRQNPQFWFKQRQRMTSYWNAYYRATYPKFDDYPASDILRFCNNLINTNPQL